MMPQDNFDYLKETPETNAMAWLRQVPIVGYGFITKILDDQTVRVAPSVQRNPDNFVAVVDVTLIGLSSALCEVSVQPQLHDQVLLLSANKFHPDMFNPISSRDEGEEVLQGKDTNGYSINSLMGILMTTIKGMAAVQMAIQKVGDETVADIRFNAIANITSQKEFNFTFNSPDEKEHPVTVTLAPKRPMTFHQRAAVTHRAGYDGKDDDDELDAPTKIERSEKAPVDAEIDAPITAKLGEKAEIDIESEAGFKTLFKKAIEFVSEKAASLFVDGSGKVKIGNNTATVKELLDEYNDILANFDTTGSPASHMTGPGAKGKLAALKSKQGQVLE